MEDDTAGLPEELAAEPVGPPAPPRRGTVLKGLGIVTAGLVAGALGVAAISSASGAPGTAHAAGTGHLAAPGGQGQQGSRGGPPGVDGGRGGRAGETRLRGTITAVGSASLTVEALDGTTTTVPVDGATEVVRDGSRAALSALRAGDQVLVHVVPAGTSTVAERVLAGTSASQGPGPDGPPPGAQAPAGGPPGSST